VARGFFILALFGAALLAQAQQQQEPPEEDATLIEKKEYTFNPLQAESEIKIGKFYMKKASYKAAIQRFSEATKWNPNSPDAWLALGEAYEKAKDAKNAKQAYAKYIELAPDAKNAGAIKKKL